MERCIQKLNIKTWAKADRPREKLLSQGRRSLSDTELLAILIGSGSQNETAVDLSKRILLAYQNDLDKLGRVGRKDLTKFKGMGLAKSVIIIAALELGRRRKKKSNDDAVHIKFSSDAYQFLKPQLADLDHEEFWVLLLNSSNTVIGKWLISIGGLSTTVVDPKMVYRLALEQNAAAMIVAHNHPSGNMLFSKQDLELTQRLIEVGRALHLPVLDHLLITNHDFLSMADEGLLNFTNLCKQI